MVGWVAKTVVQCTTPVYDKPPEMPPMDPLAATKRAQRSSRSSCVKFALLPPSIMNRIVKEEESARPVVVRVGHPPLPLPLPACGWKEGENDGPAKRYGLEE